MNKVRIILDTNENAKSNGIIAYLHGIKQNKDIDFSLEPLYVGDLWINNIILEFKTYADLVSIHDGALRIISQRDRLLELRKKGHQIAIIITQFNYENIWGKLYDKKQKQQCGLISSLMFKYNIPVYALHDKHRAVNWIDNLIKRELKGKNKMNEEEQVLLSVRTTPKTLTTNYQRALHVIQGYEGIGAKRGYNILDQVESLEGFYELLKNRDLYTDEISKIYPKNLYESHRQLHKLKWEDFI